MDPLGHDSRPDLIRLLVDDQLKYFVVRANPNVYTDTSYLAANSGQTFLSTHVFLETLLEEILRYIVVVPRTYLQEKK